MWSFSGKATSGLGTFIAGLGLDVIGWPNGAQIAAAGVGSDVLFRLGLLYGPIVCGFAVLSVWCYGHYTLDRTRPGNPKPSSSFGAADNKLRRRVRPIPRFRRWRQWSRARDSPVAPVASVLAHPWVPYSCS